MTKRNCRHFGRLQRCLKRRIPRSNPSKRVPQITLQGGPTHILPNGKFAESSTQKGLGKGPGLWKNLQKRVAVHPSKHQKKHQTFLILPILITSTFDFVESLSALTWMAKGQPTFLSSIPGFTSTVQVYSSHSISFSLVIVTQRSRHQDTKGWRQQKLWARVELSTFLEKFSNSPHYEGSLQNKHDSKAQSCNSIVV